ncbi:MAG: hypothetical protein V2G48_01460 [bacterium JZ-2024 1]
MSCPGTKCACLDGASAQYEITGDLNYPLRIIITLNPNCSETIAAVTCIHFGDVPAEAIGTCIQSGNTLTVTCRPPQGRGGSFIISIGHIDVLGEQHEGRISTPYVPIV